jgi:hypothetical protein
VPTRREALGVLGASAATALAGCGRAVRANQVPGALKFVNNRQSTETVVVRVLFKGEPKREGDDPTPTPIGDNETRAGKFRLPPQSTSYSQSFFQRPGDYVVEAKNGDKVATGRISLYRTISGGLGADMVTITLPTVGDISLSVSDVD